MHEIYCKCRSSPPEVFLGKGVLKICSKFTGEHPCRSVISIKLLCNFIKIALRHGCSPVNLLHIFRTTFLRTPLEVCFYKCMVLSKEIRNQFIPLVSFHIPSEHGKRWDQKKPETNMCWGKGDYSELMSWETFAFHNFYLLIFKTKYLFLKLSIFLCFPSWQTPCNV